MAPTLDRRLTRLILPLALLTALPAAARRGPGHEATIQNAEVAWQGLEAESLKHREPALPAPAAAPAAPPPAARTTEAQAPEVAAPELEPGATLEDDALAAHADDALEAPLADLPPDDPFAGPAGAQPWDRAPLDRPIDLDHLDPHLLADAVLRATNDVRRRNGLRPLMGHRKLDRAAAGHAHRMARLGFFDHTDPHDATRSTPTRRARLAGVQNPFVAENLASLLALDHPADQPVYVLDRAAGRFGAHPKGPALPLRSYRSLGREVVARWMASPGHRRNLLSPHALQLGAGAVGFRQHGELPSVTVVQVFQWYQPAR